MAVTFKARRTRYDNIAQGEATGAERTISGSAPPSVTAVGNAENPISGEDTMTLDQQGDGSASDITATNTTDPTDENTGSSNTAGATTNP